MVENVRQTLALAVRSAKRGYTHLV